MKPIEDMTYFEPVNKMAEILGQKTQADDPLFFRLMVSFYFANVAASMRARIKAQDIGQDIPINMYAINLAPSGHGKTLSANIMEGEILNKFRDNFMENTFHEVSDRHIKKMATRRSIKKNTDQDEELEDTRKEFTEAGEYAFSFDSGTTAALKQMMHKLQMGRIGSMNVVMDEIASNLSGNAELLSTALELFDMGNLKIKLTKNTKENIRGKALYNPVPMNLLMFGTPAKLLDNGPLQESFLQFLEIGYARRTFFGYSDELSTNQDKTPTEIFDILTNNSSTTYFDKLQQSIAALSTTINYNLALTVSKDTSIGLIEYQQYCDKRAAKMGKHETLLKSELSHRKFKVLKLAGAYAFIDQSDEITMDYIENAIKLAEDSGDAFARIVKKDRPYVKLAKYLAEVGKEVTHVDIAEDLPFYKGSAPHKNELMSYAIAYSYRKNITIKSFLVDGIEFFKGDTIKKSDLSKLTISYSANITEGYTTSEVNWDDLHKLTTLNDYHFTNHKLKEGYRNEDNSLPGFDLVILDIDNGISLHDAKILMKDYKFLTYTTKRHTSDMNRFRMILPLDHKVELNAIDYAEFMTNLYNWLPFKVDTQTNQRARKWSTYTSNTEYNEGGVLNALLFIPKTTKAVETRNRISDLYALTNLERWFILNTCIGNRSNQLMKYAYVLLDMGLEFEAINSNVLNLNDKLKKSLPKAEIQSTIMQTIKRRIRTGG